MLDLAINFFLQVLETTLPVTTVIIFFVLRRHDEQIMVEVLNRALPMDEVIVVAHDGHFVLERKLILPVDDELKSIGHDCNKHIEQHNLCEEC